MILCAYGCGQEAKHQFKNGKYCCSEYISGCPSINKKQCQGNKNKKFSIQRRKNISNSLKGRFLSEKHKINIGNGNIGKKLSISKIKKKYPFFSKIEKMRYNPDKPEEKEIQVHCKNHNCPNSKEQGGWFTPTYTHLYERIRRLERENAGCYFYCSEKCKNNCPLYNLKSDPYKSIEKPYTSEEYQTFREFVLKRDNYKCQYCGKKAEHIHHERPQKLEPFFTLDPDLAWSVCKKCHYQYGHKTDSECSTGSLSKRVC